MTQLNRRNLIIAGAAVVLAAGAGAYYFRGRGGEPRGSTSVAGSAMDMAELLQPHPLGDMTLGDENAPVVMIDYASLTCPHCANFHNNTMARLKADYIDTGRVRYIFRSFPFDDAALAAAMLARCMPEDRFFAMIGVLFERQREWAANSQTVRSELFRIANMAGMTRSEFEACLTNEEIAKGIIDGRERAASEFGVNSTPTFFINGQVVRGNRPYDEIRGIIDAELG